MDEIEIIPATDLLYLDQEVGSVVTQIKDSFEEQYQRWMIYLKVILKKNHDRY